jgi:uncharacterized cupredoxin-like copper-binding protein
MKYQMAFASLIVFAATAGGQASHADHNAIARPASARSANTVIVRGDGIRTVTVTASDYSFAAPDTIPAGLTELRLLNRGTEMHHAMLIRLDAGKTMADLFAAMQTDGPLPAWAHEAGGPNTPGPGGESNAILRLVAGRYAMICVIPSTDGKPHVMKGMAKEIVVTPAISNTSNANMRVNSTMTLFDYAFQLSQPLQAGRQTIRVKNTAGQPHEVVFVKLQPGKKTADVLAWMDKMEGPPPGAPVGGTTPMANGEENIITVDLVPGEYGLVCFVPDAKDAKPHAMHGMMTQLTISPAK